MCFPPLALAKTRQLHRANSGADGFTLVELMVSMGILAILMLVTLAIVSQTQDLYTKTSGKVSAFRESRAAFESLTRRISQASLNTYFDYVDASGKTRGEVEIAGGNFVPDQYVRQSELHFVAGPADDLLSTLPATNGELRPTHGIFFQAMLGFSGEPSSGDAQLTNLLNAIGYFVEYGSDSRFRPDFLDGIIPAKNCYRLMQMVQATENLEIYGQPLTATNRFDWFRNPLGATQSPARPIAENIIAAIFWAQRAPEDNGGGPLTTNFKYDTKGYLEGGNATSRNQLPPFVQVTLIALDEPSADRLERKYGGTAPLLKPGKLFTEVTKFDADLTDLTDFLNDERLNYRLFTTNVLIRQAKFSKD